MITGEEEMLRLVIKDYTMKFNPYFKLQNHLSGFSANQSVKLTFFFFLILSEYPTPLRKK